MLFSGSEEEIEEWYERAKEKLDESYRKELEKDLHDRPSKEKYNRKLRQLQDKYEQEHRVLLKRKERQEKFRQSALAMFLKKLKWRWLLFMQRLSKKKIEPEKEIPDKFILYLRKLEQK